MTSNFSRGKRSKLVCAWPDVAAATVTSPTAARLVSRRHIASGQRQFDQERPAAASRVAEEIGELFEAVGARGLHAHRICHRHPFERWAVDLEAIARGLSRD